MAPDHVPDEHHRLPPIRRFHRETHRRAGSQMRAHLELCTAQAQIQNVHLPAETDGGRLQGGPQAHGAASERPEVLVKGHFCVSHATTGRLQLLGVQAAAPLR